MEVEVIEHAYYEKHRPYFSLICKAEILYPPQFYLKRSILIQDPWLKHITSMLCNLYSFQAMRTCKMSK